MKYAGINEGIKRRVKEYTNSDMFVKILKMMILSLLLIAYFNLNGNTNLVI